MLSRNILALVRIHAGDIYNVGLVTDLLLDCIDDDLRLPIAKGFANDLLQEIVLRTRLNGACRLIADRSNRRTLDDLVATFTHVQGRTDRNFLAFRARFDTFKVLGRPNGNVDN